MKIYKIIFASLIILLSLQSCNKGRIWGIRGKGSNVSETRNAGIFKGIDLRCDADIEIIKDSTFSIEITGQQNILQVLTTKVEGNNLIIDFRKRVWHHNKLKLVIHTADIQSVFLSGSGDIRSSATFTVSTFECKISGSGNISLTSVNTHYLKAHISGSGNINVYAGTISDAAYSVSGSGNINALDAMANKASAKVSGSGNIGVYVTENFDVNISGSGDVKYKGNPLVNSSISGSGKVTHI